jgi:1-pyrroline-5-carboxylate dehydrogenase
LLRFKRKVNAQMVKLVDTLVSGTSERKLVQVRVLFWAPCNKMKPPQQKSCRGFFISGRSNRRSKPDYITIVEELFGPVLTIFVYADEDLDKTLDILDKTSAYALTVTIFSQDRYNIEKMTKRLENAAGNFYINDKPTGATVGQQPFGGARGSGTNDKAGSVFNFLRWTSIRIIKENFVSPKSYMYPNFLPDQE